MNRAVEDVLAGIRSYDELTGSEQQLVRGVWDERVDEARAGLDLASEFRAAGVRNWVEADGSGQVVYRS